MMKELLLNNGVKMPQEGFGVYQISDLRQCEKAVYEAIRAGYRMIDTAAVYGNEEAVGRAVDRAVEDGIVKREDLFIQSKVWVQDQKDEQTAFEAVKASLERLRLDCLDSMLLHQAMGDYFAAYRGLEKALKAGLVKTIGVANFFPETLMNLCENAEVTPAVNQVEMNPYFTQEKALENMKELGVTPQAWAPFAEGNHGIFSDPEFSEIGEKYHKSAAQVVLRWNIQRGVSVIPKSVHEDRMKQNIDIWDFELTDEEMSRISARDLGRSGIIDHYDPKLVRMLNEMKIH